MQILHPNSQLHYMLHAWPVALVLGSVFFLLGLALGAILWRRAKPRAEAVEQANTVLRAERARLEAELNQHVKETEPPKRC